MQKLHNYSIDIANNPAQAIESISNPILALLNLRVDDY